MAFEDMNEREAYQFGSMAVSPAINATVNTDGNKCTCLVSISVAEPKDPCCSTEPGGKMQRGEETREKVTIPQQLAPKAMRLAAMGTAGGKAVGFQ